MNQSFIYLSSRKSRCLLIIALVLVTIGLPVVLADWIKDPAQNMPVCRAKNEQHFPSLASDGHGGLIVAWRDARNENRDVFAQRISATGEMMWGNDGIPICDLRVAQSWPFVITDKSGGAIIVFGDFRHGNQDIFAQRIDVNGRLLWEQDGVPVCTHPTLQDDIKAISDGEGGAIVVWEDWRNKNQDIYAQRIDSNGKPVWAVNGVPVYAGTGDQYDPILAQDGTGGAIFVWFDISTPDFDIFAQRIDATGQPVWGDKGLPVCTGNGNQGGPVVCPDGSGGAYVVWPDHRDDPNIFASADIYGQRISATGNLLWEENGISICNHPANQQKPQTRSDGAGGLMVVWQDDRDVFFDIYAQRLNGDGKPMWEANGIVACAAAGEQREPHLVPIDSQGVIIYWRDFREDYGNTTADAIYAQRIDADGKSLWAFNGIPVCTADGDQISPQVIADGKGGAFIVWSDTRHGDHDTYIHPVPSTT